MRVPDPQTARVEHDATLVLPEKQESFHPNVRGQAEYAKALNHYIADKIAPGCAAGEEWATRQGGGSSTCTCTGRGYGPNIEHQLAAEGRVKGARG